MKSSGHLKVAYIGGGSRFVPSIIHGIAHDMQKEGAFDLCVSLFDIRKERAERMARYARLLSTPSTPIEIKVADSQDEALENADLVFASVGLWEDHRKVHRELETADAQLPDPGPGTAAEAVAVAPFFFGLAQAMKRHCPEALLASLVNPTDVLALAIAKMGLRAAGVCVEVEGLRGALAYYFRVPEECIEMTYAGVNHDGWTLAIRVNGEDGYDLWRDQFPRLPEDPNFHPGNYGMLPVLELTGHLRSSAYHHPPFHFEAGPRSEDWQRWSGKGGDRESALEQALRHGKPISDPPNIHPEQSLLTYPGTGRAIGRMIGAMATGRSAVVPLQVMNQGAIRNFPDDVCVEIPTLVKGRQITPQTVGKLPEWLGGVTRLFAIQRRMIADYLLDPSLALLKQAISIFPVLGATERHVRFATVLHDFYNMFPSSII